MCHTAIWVDADSQTVVRHEKTKKKSNASFDSLLAKEKEKKEKVDQRFRAASELEREKKRRAEDLFKKSLVDEE